MLALITNDDGLDSIGLRVLAASAAELGMDVLVAVPSWDSSGASASLTSVEKDGRLLVEETELEGVAGRCVAVEAAPAYIVRAALSGAFGERPDVVLSGVNRGPNTGHAVLHSGTVGAALTAATARTPALAFSLDTPADGRNWDTAAIVARVVIERMSWDRHRGWALNVNVPDVTPDELRGLAAARLAPFGAVSVVVTEIGAGYVSMQYSAPDEQAGQGTDVALLADGFATITMLEPIGERVDADLATITTDFSPSGFSSTGFSGRGGG